MRYFWEGFEKRADEFEFKSPEQKKEESKDLQRKIIPAAVAAPAAAYGAVQGGALGDWGASSLRARGAVEEHAKQLKAIGGKVSDKQKEKMLKEMRSINAGATRGGLMHPIEQGKALLSSLANEAVGDLHPGKLMGDKKIFGAKIPKSTVIPSGTPLLSKGWKGKGAIVAGGLLGGGALGYGAYKGVRALQDKLTEKKGEDSRIPEFAGGVGGLMLGTELARKAGYQHHGTIPIALLTGLGGASAVHHMLKKKKAE